MLKYMTGLCMALLLWSSPQKAHAGVPVIDIANLAQAVMDVLNAIDQLQYMKDQYDELVKQAEQGEAQYKALTGARNLGHALNNPKFKNYLPADAAATLRKINEGGYDSLTAYAKALRNASKVYNCEDLPDAVQQRCERELGAPYQYQAFYEEADNAAKSRVDQINQLLTLASTTEDPKEIAEVQARISGEIALLEHEKSRIDLVRAMADSSEQIARAQGQERKRARAARTGKLGSAFGGP